MKGKRDQHEQEARVLLGVGTHEPCDCITFDERFWSQRCYCHNSGDLERAQDWVTSANLVEPIAEALRKRDAEIDQLREQVTQLLADNQVVIQCQEDDKAEIEWLQVKLGQLNADFMAMRDGALVRDLQMRNSELIAEYDQMALIVSKLRAENDKLKVDIKELTVALDAAIEDRDYFHKLYSEGK